MPKEYEFIQSPGNKTVIGPDTGRLLAGIAFPTVQIPSQDANVLDDYEEGSWTPSVMFGTDSTGITYSGQGGLYIKIGRYVVTMFSISLSSKGTAVGNAEITDFPFAFSANSWESHGELSTWTLNTAIIRGIVFGSSGGAGTTAGLIKIAAAQTSTGDAADRMTDADFTDSSVFSGFLIYRTTN